MKFKIGDRVTGDHLNGRIYEVKDCGSCHDLTRRYKVPFGDYKETFGVIYGFIRNEDGKIISTNWDRETSLRHVSPLEEELN